MVLFILKLINRFFAEHDTDEKLEEKIKQTQGDERQLVDKLLNKNDILEQLTFMKYVFSFY